LLVLYVGSQLLSTVLMSTTTDRNQKLIMYALPFFFVAFVWNFPAGLLVYWITTNLWTIVQQAIVRKRLGPLKPPPDAAGTGPPGTPATATAGARAAVPGARPSGRKEQREEELVEAGKGGPKPRSGGPPPAPPRKKKKRSGRRR
jgi:YidC/Oxa1 family membrane protein insertase